MQYLLALLPLGLYIAAYCLVRSDETWLVSGGTGLYQVRYASYPPLPAAASWAFFPIEAIDEQLRPHYWQSDEIPPSSLSPTVDANDIELLKFAGSQGARIHWIPDGDYPMHLSFSEGGVTDDDVQHLLALSMPMTLNLSGTLLSKSAVDMLLHHLDIDILFLSTSNLGCDYIDKIRAEHQDLMVVEAP